MGDKRVMGSEGEGANVLLGGGPAVRPAAASDASTASAGRTAPAGSFGSAESPPVASSPPRASSAGESDHPAHTAHVAQAIRAAHDARAPLRITAGGGWLGAGRPIERPTRRLDLRGLAGIVEYNPGDLTLTARAATTLAEIDHATRAHGQWLPLDPLGADTDTIGATLATASCGPLAASLGLPRDLALGIEFVDGRGTVVRAGGKVVKNVAGFDLVRLTVGAWGTLGVITEVTVRLRARPEGAVTIALDLPSDPQSLASLLRTIRAAALTPLAAELLSARLAERLGVAVAGRDVMLVRLAGNAASLAAQRVQLSSLGESREVADDAWTALRGAAAPAACSFRLSQRPSRLAELWSDVRGAAHDLGGAVFHASLERGVARCLVPEPDLAPLAEQVALLMQRWNIIGEELPSSLWSILWPAGTDRLSAGVRAAFDPHAILNPGLLVPER